MEGVQKNPYDDVKNPEGIIQMGIAENQLSFDILESWLAENPDAAGFKRDEQSTFRELALFQDYHGLPAFKKALVDFMAEIRGNKVKFDPNRIVLMNLRRCLISTQQNNPALLLFRQLIPATSSPVTSILCRCFNLL
ncbi:hypothetical protein SLE2022_390040 [Rubroshorea leprosula]